MLGNSELIGATNQPWTHRPEASWYVVADAAATAEAILVIDRQTAASGLLPEVHSSRALTQRLIAGDVARMARWFGTDNSADLATRSVNAGLQVGGGPPIVMVSRPEDFASAQRALTGFLHPTRADHEAGSAQERPGLLAARALAVGQGRLAEASARWAETHGGAGASLAEEFRARIPRHRALHQATLRLTEVEPRRSPLIMAQQSEIVIQLRALDRPRLTRASLLDLNQATHQTTVTIGKALRREGMHRKNILTLESRGESLDEPRPITNTRQAFHAACTGLASDPAPAALYARGTAPIERERLRMALDESPSGPSAPVRRMSPRIAQSSAPGLHRGRGAKGPERSRG